MRKPHRNASALRKKMPPTEQRLWYFIRRKQLGGFRFRRQHTIGPYVADFACVEAMLVIELDGEQHARGKARERDAKRDQFMDQEGWIVMRFWNHEILNHIDSVQAAILDRAENSVRATEVERGVRQESE